MSDNVFQENSDQEAEQIDLEAQLRVDVDEISRWIDRLPKDVKAALQNKGGALFPTEASEKFKFPETLHSGDNDIIGAFGNGGRLWLMARIFKLSWPHTGVLAQDIFEIEGVGAMLKEDLSKLKSPIAIRMIKFLLACKEFRQGVTALSMIPGIGAE